MASAGDEPVISVSSSPREVAVEAAAPGKEGPPSVPEKGRDAMVCVKATRSSQTPPLIVPEKHRALEETSSNAQTINWTMACRTQIVKGHWVLYEREGDPDLDL